jgi:hypothetical protein
MARVPLLATVFLACAACSRMLPAEDWTCDFDASESRPLADPGADTDEAGHLASSECQATCGAAVSCTRTLLDGGVPGAVCPVCTF